MTYSFFATTITVVELAISNPKIRSKLVQEC